jgi:hypothetical protein
MVQLHVLANQIGHVLVKASQQDGPDHDGGIKAHSSEEASALKGDIGCTYEECLAWMLLHGEDVITGDSKLSGSWNVRVGRSSSRGNNDVCSSHGLLSSIGLGEFDGVRVYECGKLIEVFALGFDQF